MSPHVKTEVTVRVDPFLDGALAARVREVLEEAIRRPLDVTATGAAGERWVPAGSAAPEGNGTADGAAGPVPVTVVASPDALPSDESGHEAFVAGLTGGGAQVVVLATVSPAAATTGPGHWPAHWVDRFDRVGWRFCDLVRPALWDDPAFGPDVKEGFLVFVAPGVLGDLRASPPLALVHPHRLPALVAGVEAELGELRARFLERLQPLAHRSELEVLAARMADTVRTTEGQRQRSMAQDARIAALERRLTLVLDTFAAERLVQARAALAPAAGAGPPAEPSRARRLLRFLTGQDVARTPATPDAAPALPDPAVIGLFDEAYYVERNPAAADAPLAHYLREGERLGRRPNPWFDPIHYGERNPDVLQSGMNLLTHYARFGGQEGRAASPEFDSEWYMTTHPDVRRSGLNPLLHFLLVGAALGYRPSPEPDPLADDGGDTRSDR